MILLFTKDYVYLTWVLRMDISSSKLDSLILDCSLIWNFEASVISKCLWFVQKSNFQISNDLINLLLVDIQKIKISKNYKFNDLVHFLLVDVHLLLQSTHRLFQHSRAVLFIFSAGSQKKHKQKQILDKHTK